jgi:hypothetical protein
MNDELQKLEKEVTVTHLKCHQNICDWTEESHKHFRKARRKYPNLEYKTSMGG